MSFVKKKFSLQIFNTTIGSLSNCKGPINTLFTNFLIQLIGSGGFRGNNSGRLSVKILPNPQNFQEGFSDKKYVFKQTTIRRIEALLHR
jgi:hypothetical protein